MTPIFTISQKPNNLSALSTPINSKPPSYTTFLIPRSLGSPVSYLSYLFVFLSYYCHANCDCLEGQVQPFWLTTADEEKLFCWHVLPLDVYLENEYELFTSAVSGEIAEELKGTVGEKLLSSDPDSKVVVNFHGVSSSFVQLLIPFSNAPLIFPRSLQSYRIPCPFSSPSQVIPFKTILLLSLHQSNILSQHHHHHHHHHL
jgi:hypothetical protein